MLTCWGNEGEGAVMENEFFLLGLEVKKDSLVKSGLPGQ